MSSSIFFSNTQNPRNEEPPPSYESLFGKMKNCGEETANAFGFMRTSTSILLENGKFVKVKDDALLLEEIKGIPPKMDIKAISYECCSNFLEIVSYEYFVLPRVVF